MPPLRMYSVVALIFIPIGISLTVYNDGLREVVEDYTCTEYDGAEKKVDIQIGDAPWEAPVFLYYGLDNFHQNTRNYANSRDDEQLKGVIEEEPSEDCGEYSYTRAWKSEIFTAPNLTFAQEVRIAVQTLPGHYSLLRT